MRRPTQTEEGKQADIVYLTRCMRRIQLSDRPEKKKTELVGHLKAVISGLMQDDAPVTKKRTG